MTKALAHWIAVEFICDWGDERYDVFLRFFRKGESLLPRHRTGPKQSPACTRRRLRIGALPRKGTERWPGTRHAG